MGKAGIEIRNIYLCKCIYKPQKKIKKVSSHFHWVWMLALVVFSTMLAANFESLWVSAVSQPERTQYPKPPPNSPPFQHQQENCTVIVQVKAQKTMSQITRGGRKEENHLTIPEGQPHI